MAAEPQRFADLMRDSGRRRDASRVAVSVLKVHSRLARRLERRLAEAGLTLPQFVVLMELASTPGEALPLYEINARLISSAPNMSWLCARMEKSGLVKRRRDTKDTRVVIVAIAERGWRALGEAAPLIFEAEKELFKDFSGAELRQIADQLSRFLDCT